MSDYPRLIVTGVGGDVFECKCKICERVYRVIPEGEFKDSGICPQCRQDRADKVDRMRDSSIHPLKAIMEKFTKRCQKNE